MVFRDLFRGPGSDTTVIVECRDCGTKLNRGDIRTCPECRSDEIARYVIDE